MSAKTGTVVWVVLVLLLLFAGASLHSLAWRVDSVGDDIYYAWLEGLRLRAGPDPAERLRRRPLPDRVPFHHDDIANAGLGQVKRDAQADDTAADDDDLGRTGKNLQGAPPMHLSIPTRTLQVHRTVLQETV